MPIQNTLLLWEGDEAPPHDRVRHPVAVPAATLIAAQAEQIAVLESARDEYAALYADRVGQLNAANSTVAALTAALAEIAEGRTIRFTGSAHHNRPLRDKDAQKIARAAIASAQTGEG